MPDKSISLYANDCTTFLTRAHLQIQMRKFPSALKDCDQAVSVSTTHTGYALHAAVYALLNSQNEALKDFNTIQLLASQDKQPYITFQRIGIMFLHLKEYENTMFFFNKSYEQSANGFKAIAKLEIGVCYYLMGKTEEGMTKILTAITLNSTVFITLLKESK